LEKGGLFCAVKRILCVFLIFTCLFFTGCNSIIYNGNLKFSAYEPETLGSVVDDVGRLVENTQEDGNSEKYNIEGTNAFYILPNHEDNPEKILDFKVLDYNSRGEFVYAYITPYYGGLNADGSTGETGLSGTASWGKTRTTDTYKNMDSGGQIVTVLMSYHPDTMAYHVFVSLPGKLPETSSGTKEAEKTEESVGSGVDAGGKMLMAQKLSDREEYFIYVDNISYVYDKNGGLIEQYDYSSLIAQEIAYFKKKYEQKNVAQEVTINDVVMDGSYFIYVPVTLELSSNDMDSDKFDDIDEADAEQESKTYREIICCYELDIGDGGRVRFTSDNTRWQAQQELWTNDGEVITFSSREEMEAYQRNCTLNRIKSGAYKGDDGTDLADSFTIFSTGAPYNLNLAAIGDFSGFRFHKVDAEGNNAGKSMNFSLYTWLLRTAEVLREKGMADDSGISWYWMVNHYYFFSYYNLWKNTVFQKKALQRMGGGVLEKWMTAAKTAAMLAAEGDVRIMKAAEGDRYHSGEAYTIPGVYPHEWDEKRGFNPADPLVWSGSGSKNDNILDALFAEKVTVRTDREGRQQVASRYADIRIPGYYEDVRNPGRAVFQATAWTDKITRTLQYEVVSEVEDENGETHTETEIVTVEETADPVPRTYEITFPKGSRVCWTEVRETDEVVAPSSETGVIYYRENERKSSDEKCFSTISFHNGYAFLLSDASAEGSAADAGLYYVNGAELLIFITNTGIHFYRKGASDAVFRKVRYTTLENLSQETAFAINSFGKYSFTENAEEEVSIKDSEENEIIDNKLKNGEGSEIYSSQNFVPIDQHKILVSSLYNGLMFHNLINGFTIQMRTGSYYASFPTNVSGGKNGEYISVGYYTDEYYYQPGDIALAKCYRNDIEGISGKVMDEMLTGYLDGLAKSYLIRAHRVEYQNGKAVIVKGRSEEKETDDQAKRLFYQDEASAQAELKKLAAGLGVTTISQDLQNYARNLAARLKDQKTALAEFYQMAGFANGTVEYDASLLELEGQMITANYVDTLENVLVQLRLRDDVIRQLPVSEQAVYRSYQTQAEQSGWNTMTAIESLTAAEVKDKIKDTEFYREILSDLRSEYEARRTERGGSWDSYMEGLLKRISPYNSIVLREQGLLEFYSLAGINQELLGDQECAELEEEISGIWSVWELERLIIRFRLKTADYQNSPYKQELEAFEEKKFSDQAEEIKAFYNAGFYQIIVDLKAANEKALREDGKEWEDVMEGIIGKCGAGVVVPTDMESD